MPDLWHSRPMTMVGGSRRGGGGRAVRVFGAIAFAAIVLVSTGCSDDETEPEPDAAGACKDMCSGIGFATSRVDVQANETRCVCAGAGTVARDECARMCTAIGKGSSQPYRSGAAAGDDACRCQ
ncbi:MAG: hypothetical protein KF894_02860 [Labilithrix sp.]|nr:hypothetical protein [Labilithrix sp.]